MVFLRNVVCFIVKYSNVPGCVKLFPMTKLLDQAIERLRRLPALMQDSAARAVIRQLEEEPEAGDREAVAEGRRQFQRGDFVTLDQLRHDMGLGDR